MTKPTIIVDTREKQPFWEPKEYEDFFVIRQKLDVGDYTIQGLEQKICIERKKTPRELYSNLTSGRNRFYREIERMKDIQFNFLVLECDYEVAANPLSYRVIRNNKSAPAVVLSSLISLQVLNKIQVVFAGKNGRGYVKRLLMKALEYSNKGILN